LSSIENLAKRLEEEALRKLEEVHRKGVEELRMLRNQAANEVRKRLDEAARRFSEKVSS
jgi:vacuolar-type H+-ATPase subunit E/Vma4